MIRALRVALRGLRRAPTFTITTVLILGLGIGASAAVFTVFRAVLLQRLPVRDPDRVVLPAIVDEAGTDVAMSRDDIKAMAPHSRTMREMASIAHWNAQPFPVTYNDQPVTLAAALVSGNFFDLLGVRPVIGRLIRRDDDAKGAPVVIVLSYGAWQRQFGGDPSVIGRHLTLPYDGSPYTIVGVAPPGLDYPVGTDYWRGEAHGVASDVIARLAPGATLATARAEMMTLTQSLDRHHDLGHSYRAQIRTLATGVTGNVRPVLIVLTAAVGLLLAIACANVGNLLLLRAGTRARELAVRRALGATPGDIVRHLLLESGLLAVAGGALGLACAEFLRRTLITAAPRELPRLDAVRVAGAPLGLALGLTGIAVLAFGVVPAFLAGARSPMSPLRLDRRAGTGTRDRQRTRQLLVAAQVALALVMLAGAGLLVRSLQQLETIPLGFRPSHLTMLSFTFRITATDSEPMKDYDRFDAIAPRLRAIPGITSLTPTTIEPLLGANVWTALWVTEQQPQPDAGVWIPQESGNADYFRTFGIPIVRGRGFLDTDREKSPLVVVVSEAVARRFWPGADPIGKRIRYDGGDTVTWRTVVGVAGDTHLRTLRESTPTVFVPYRQFYWQGWVAIRTAVPLATVLPAIRKATAHIEPGLQLYRAQTMDQLLDAPLAQPRMSALLLSAFGMVALALAAIGLYGIMATAVRESTRDIGIRMALGATPDRVRREVLGRALAVSAAGAVVGIVVALALSRLVASLLYQVRPYDPIALIAACVVLLAVAMFAAFFPAHQATRVDPARALQAD